MQRKLKKEDVMEIIDKYKDDYYIHITHMDIYTREVKECLEALPSVTPQPKTGRWIEHFDESGNILQ